MFRSTFAYAIFRVINVALAILWLGHSQPSPSWVACIGWMVLAILVTVLWESDRRSVGSQIHMIERALGKQNEFEFAEIFISYRFEASSTLGSTVLRYEPYLWLALNLFSVLAVFVPFGSPLKA